MVFLRNIYFVALFTLLSSSVFVQGDCDAECPLNRICNRMDGKCYGGLPCFSETRKLMEGIKEKNVLPKASIVNTSVDSGFNVISYDFSKDPDYVSLFQRNCTGRGGDNSAVSFTAACVSQSHDGSTALILVDAVKQPVCYSKSCNSAGNPKGRLEDVFLVDELFMRPTEDLPELVRRSTEPWDCVDLDQYMDCNVQTWSIMEAIKGDYKTSKVTTRTVILQDKTMLILDDFSTNQGNNVGYRFACNGQGGDYVELHYNAICQAKGADGRTKASANLFVKGQPRCYSKACPKFNVASSSLLLLDFTVIPTEDRADLDSHSTEIWKCTGTLRDPSTNLCQSMSDVINNTRDIQVATVSLEPQLQEQKDGLFIKEERLVVFVGYDPTTYSESCVAGGGTEHSFSGKLSCGTSKFQVDKFPVCLWPLCGNYTSGEVQDMIKLRLQSHLAAFDVIQKKSKCKFSSSPKGSYQLFSVDAGSIAAFATMLLLGVWLFP